MHKDPPFAKKRVICVISLRLFTGQQQFSGLLDFCTSSRNWELEAISTGDFSARTVRRAIAEGVDGFILTMPGSPDAMRILAKTDIPLILTNVASAALGFRRKRISYVWTDNADIGEKGAEYLMSRTSFDSFAFVPASGDPFWSHERGRAFRHYLADRGRKCEFHPLGEPMDSWLKRLRKPVAIMAACDEVAVDVLKACRRLKLGIPDSVAVLGVDNSSLGSQTSQIPISSVSVDFRQMGYLQGKELDSLMRNADYDGTAEVLIPVKEVIPRKSTAVVPRRAELIARALKFISRNACSGISTSDVVAEVGCSRRLLELRFRQMRNASIHDEIERIRLAKALELAKSTKASAREIASRCGFPSPDMMTRALKKRQGTSFRDLFSNMSRASAIH